MTRHMSKEMAIPFNKVILPCCGGQFRCQVV